MIWAIFWTIRLEFGANLERLPFSPRCELTLRRGLVQHILVLSQRRPLLMQQSFAKLTIVAP